MKNYYRILQVDLNADPELIIAAYKLLMKKYHPDILSSEQKVNKSLLEKVQEINEAYSVLSDSKKRKEYDKVWKEFEKISQPLENKTNQAILTIQKRIYMVRCAVSKKEYRMLLARRKGLQSKFTILGFEPVETLFTPKPGENWLVKVSKNLLAKPQKTIHRQTRMGFMSDEEIKNMFSDENMMSIADVDWTGKHNCPDCGCEIVTPTGVVVHWFRCGSCSHLYCVGNAKVGKLDAVTKCPWCNMSNTIQWNSSKDKKQLIIGGREYEETEGNRHLLSEKGQKALKDGKQ